MARLADVYRQDGFQDGRPGGELPDHLTVVLRYLAAAPDGPSRTAVLEDALVPALEKMVAALPDGDDAYRPVLAALREEVTR
jgi:nitrate reductase delta subunit